MKAIRCLHRAAIPVLLVAALAAGSVAAVEKSRVVVARNPAAINDRNQADARETARLFDGALLAYSGEKSAAAAWRSLGLKPGDVVAVKINCDSWNIDLSPHRELVDALCRSLETVIPANNIILYDNIAAAMEKSGYAMNRGAEGVRCTSTDKGDGFDPQERLTALITATASKIINLASLKCAEGELVASLTLKNHIGSLLQEDMPKCHKDPDFLAGVSARPTIRRKTILNIITGLRGTYRRAVPWYWAGIIMGKDPVALDATGIGVMNEKRAQENLPPLSAPAYLGIAEATYGLGTADPKRIERVTLDLGGK